MKLSQDQKALVLSIKNMIRGCKFASFRYSSKSTGGTGVYTLLIGQNYRNLVIRSIEALNDMGAIEGVSNEVFAVAKRELLASMTETKTTGTNRNYTKRNIYANLGHGLKLNLNDLSLEIGGTLISYKEEKPKTNSRPAPFSEKAIAKDKIRKSLPIGKYLTLCLDIGTLHSARANGQTFELA